MCDKIIYKEGKCWNDFCANISYQNSSGGGYTDRKRTIITVSENVKCGD